MKRIKLTNSQHDALKIIVKSFLDKIEKKDKRIYELTKILYNELG